MSLERHIGLGEALIVRNSSASSADWDAFAQACGKSFRCAHRAVRVWQFETHPIHILRRLEIFAAQDGGETKIGQCAIGVGAATNIFSDSLQILPEYEGLWLYAVRCVLRKIGPGKYRYGSDWNLEISRQAELAACPGVTVTHVHDFIIQYVDFQNWPSNEDYATKVSKNIRWNVKKAEKSYPDFDISQRKGLHVRRVLRTSLLRCKTYRRKGIKRSPAVIFLRSLARNFAVPSYTNYAYFESGKKVLASVCGIEFGADTFCLEAASERDNRGAAWRLLMAMVSEAWARSQGRGRFVLGSDDRSQHDDPAWRGLMWSRQQCRVSGQPSSVIEFFYMGAAART